MTQKKGRNAAGSHRAKLLTLVRNRGEDFQFLLGRWVVERFLYRLAGFAQKDSFVLKGAMLFLAWEGRLHRPTKDLDLLGFGNPDVLDVTHRICEVCAVPADDGIVFDLAGIQGERILEAGIVRQIHDISRDHGVTARGRWHTDGTEQLRDG
jgi:hypothetical protein